MPEASDTAALPSLDPLFDLLKHFLNLHQPTYSEATLSCIIAKGGPKTFDFRGHVMFFGLQYRNDNPGTAFTISFADCLPIGTLYLHLPHIKDVLQASEEKYNSVAEFDKATMEHFAGLIRVVYEADGCFYLNNVPIRDNPQGDAANRANWLLELKLSVDNGLVGKEVGGKYQIGKVIKQGERWKWMSLSGLS
jgi:hypothetical protein